MSSSNEFLQDWMSEEDEKALEQAHYAREEIERLQELEEEEILQLEFDDEELEEIKEKASKIEHFYAYDKWKRLFDRVSFYNETAGQILFHVLLGQLVKNHKIHQQGGNYLDLRLHFFWIQDSGSGKSSAIEFLQKVASLCSIKEFGEYHPMNSYKMGRTTDASLVNSWVYDSKNHKYSNIPKDGILHNSNLVYWEEASKLITGGKFNVETQEIIMTAVEPIDSSQNIYQKQLVGYTEPAVTKSSSSFVAATRPIENLKPQLLYNGLLQRFVTYFRMLEPKDREMMFDKASLSSFKDNKDRFEEETKELALEIQKIVTFSEQVTLRLEENSKSRLLKYIAENMRWFTNDIITNVYSPELQDVLYSFTSRIRDNMIKLAAHSSLMRGSKYIEEQDIAYAYHLMKKCYESVKTWLELNFVSGGDLLLQKRKISVIALLKDHDNKLSKKELVVFLEDRWRIGKNSVYRYLNRILGIKNAPFLVSDEIVTLKV